MEQIEGYEGLYEIHLNKVGVVDNDHQPGVWSVRNQKYLKSQNHQHAVTMSLWNGKTKKFLLHRLIADHFILNPENKPEIDHIDRNPHNNKLQNLRWATRAEQCQNISCEGVYWHGNKWDARIYINGKRKHLGCFTNKDEAKAAYLAAKKEYHPFYTF